MSKNKTFFESFMTYFPLEMRAATENALMAPSQITIEKQEKVLQERVENLHKLKNHVFSNSNTNTNSNRNRNTRPSTPRANTPKNKAASRSSTGSSTGSVKSPTNMFGGRRTRRKRRN